MFIILFLIHLNKMNIKPIIYMKNSEDNPYIAAHREVHENYEIIWYEWKYDGPPAIARRQDLPDFEPVIILYKENKIVCVIVRNAWKYIPSSIEDENLLFPITVAFETDYHHPTVKTRENEDDFNKKISLLSSRTDYIVNNISADFIQPRFRIGDNHPTRWLQFWLYTPDPTDHVGEVYSDYAQLL